MKEERHVTNRGTRKKLPKIAQHTAEEWIVAYHRVLLELDQHRMGDQLCSARNAMFDRIEELRNLRGSHDIEHKAIHDALNTLRSLEKENRYWLDQQRQRAS
ncbi:MAG TPA: hypothetical protein VH079_17785 [Terriglobales bacterium]|nr:hypothetical protein [Terriglobales bacterium]